MDLIRRLAFFGLQHSLTIASLTTKLIAELNVDRLANNGMNLDLVVFWH